MLCRKNSNVDSSPKCPFVRKQPCGNKMTHGKPQMLEVRTDDFLDNKIANMIQELTTEILQLLGKRTSIVTNAEIKESRNNQMSSTGSNKCEHKRRK